MDSIKFTIIYIVTLLVPFWYVNQTWFWMLSVIGIFIAYFELGSYGEFGKTLSQRFWDASKRNKTIGIIGLSVFYIYLMCHLIFQI